jgi:serine phosphatase RsbU (regulator of sigma subunit)
VKHSRPGLFVALSATFVLLMIFAGSAFWIRGAISDNSHEQELLRRAQILRARLFRLQLDEETGVRGYVSTGAKLFLEPYFVARSAFPTVERNLTASLRALSVDDGAVRAEASINAEWLRSVAYPLLAQSPKNQLQLQVHGKSLIDRFRALDDLLAANLTERARDSDRAAASIVSRMLIGALVLGLVVAVAFATVALQQSRLADELDAQRKTYEEEKHIADALQEAFLQQKLPELSSAVLNAVYMPAGLGTKVGGDWYDAFALTEDRILFSIGDVAGHGIDAAVVMSRVRQTILSVGVEEHDPATVLARANEVLLLQDSTMVTATCGFVDLRGGSIVYSSAGHPQPIMVYDDGTSSMLAVGGPPLGALDAAEFKTSSIAIRPRSLLVLYTDGLIEYARDWETGERRLVEAVRRVRRDATSDPAASIVESIFRGAPPVDDVAVLTMFFDDAVAKGRAASANVAKIVAASARPLVDRSMVLLVRSHANLANR